MLFNTPENVEPVVSEEITTEAMAMIMEAAILDQTSPEELQAFLENHTDVNAAIRDEVLVERTIVRLDKTARINQAHKVAVFTVAREKNDPMFKKLLTVWRMERFLEDKLVKKYGNEGMRRARKSVTKSMNSRSNLVKKVATNVNKQFNKK